MNTIKLLSLINRLLSFVKSHNLKRLPGTYITLHRDTEYHLVIFHQKYFLNLHHPHPKALDHYPGHCCSPRVGQSDI